MENKRQKRKHQAGMSLIELMVAVGLMSFVMMGATAVMMSFAQTQKNTTTLVSLNLIKSQMIGYIKGGTSWANDVYQATSTNNKALQCIQTNSICANPTSGPLDTIYDATQIGIYLHGQIFYTNPANTSNKGFNMKGQPCTGFSAVVGSIGGNDNCPFQYELTMTLTCSDTTMSQCLEPTVIVTGTLVYAPATNAQGVINKTMPIINTNEYSFTVNRTQATDGINQFLYVAQQETTSNGGGTCSTAGSFRFYTSGISTAVDLASSTKGFVTSGEVSLPSVFQGNILDIPAASGTGYAIELAAGGYICDIMATAWAVDSWSLNVYVVPGSALPVASKTGYARKSGTWATQKLIIEKLFLNLSANSYLQVKQTCQTDPAGVVGSPPNFTPQSAYAMGLPASIAGVVTSLPIPAPVNVYSSIGCTRVY